MGEATQLPRACSRNIPSVIQFTEKTASSKVNDKMTLIIGLLCKDGVVIGADSIATFGSEIEQEVSYKIEIWEEDVAIATSGDIGFSQLIKEQLGPRWHEIKLCTDVLEVKNQVSSQMWKQIEPAVNRSKLGQVSFGGCETIVALPIDGAPKLLHFGKLSDPI